MDTYTLPDELRYTASHLWVRAADGQAVIGLTEHGQERFGRILYVGLPALGTPVEFGMPLGYLQSAGYGLTQLFPPVQGEVVAINEDLWREPTLVNDDPQGDGWLVTVAMSNATELEELETADGYRAVLAGQRRDVGVALTEKQLASAEPTFLIDEQRRILSVNPAAEALIGLGEKDMRNGPLCQELFGCHDEGGPVGKTGCPGLCSMLNLEATSATYRVTNAHGGQTTVRAEYAPFARPGQPRRALVTLQMVE